jgi:hypothetical protein
LRTLEDTLGKGIGWSLSPTSGKGTPLAHVSRMTLNATLTFKHVLDEHAALDDILVGVELFVVRSDE